MTVSSIVDGFLGLSTESWKYIGSAAGGTLLATGSALAFFIHFQRDFWLARDKARAEEIREIVAQLDKERGERSTREIEVERLRKEVFELRETRSEIIRQTVLKGEQFALETIKELENHIAELESQLLAKREAVAKLSADNMEHQREILKLKTEVVLRDKLLGQMKADVLQLEEGLSSNNIIVDVIDSAILDDRTTSRLLVSYRTKMSGLASEAIAIAAREEYNMRQVAHARRAQVQQAEARARSEAKEKLERRGRFTMRLDPPTDPKRK